VTLQTALDRIVAAEHRHRDVHEIALGVLEGDTFPTPAGATGRVRRWSLKPRS